MFISHASEDKERFVIRFAEALRGAGIEAWFDQWELRPGDSLIQRIFDEGIAEAEVFIVVLSRHSVNKRRVREELDAGIVRRINHKSRLIPIILDDLNDAEVPEALKATVWERITGPNDFQAALDRIIRTIFGHTDKPPLGTPPSYVTSSAPIPGLNSADAWVFSIVAEQALEGGHPMVDPNTVEARCKEQGLSHDGYFEGLLALANEDLLDIEYVHPSMIRKLEITLYGLQRYFEVALPDLDEVHRRLIAELLNGEKRDGAALAAALGERLLVVEFLLDQLAMQNLLTVGKTFGGIRVGHVSPLLRRL